MRATINILSGSCWSRYHNFFALSWFCGCSPHTRAVTDDTCIPPDKTHDLTRICCLPKWAASLGIWARIAVTPVRLIDYYFLPIFNTSELYTQFLARSSYVIVALHRFFLVFFFFEDLQEKLVQPLTLSVSTSRMSQMTFCFLMMMTDCRILIVEVVVTMIIVHETLHDVIATQLCMTAGHITRNECKHKCKWNDNVGHPWCFSCCNHRAACWCKVGEYCDRDALFLIR